MQKLLTRVQTVNSLLCVGLDPTGDDAAVAQRIQEIITETAAYAAAFKPNLAFFLSRENGVALLQANRAQHPDRHPVILDGKFGDIANTAEQYARFAYDIVGADGVTVNPLHGRRHHPAVCAAREGGFHAGQNFEQAPARPARRRYDARRLH
jgi:orotidine-5'-phosphate decarboxylase